MPLRLFASGTRTAANVSRGLMYAGMYGMFFFVGQFLQDVQGYSPLRTGLSFLPVPLSVFLSSQLVSRVLIGRVRPKALIMTGIGLTVVALFLSSRLHAGASALVSSAGQVFELGQKSPGRGYFKGGLSLRQQRRR